MIHEIAELTIDPTRSEDFEATVAQAAPLFQAADGCLSMRLERSIESPGRYLLIVGWTDVKAHTDGFRSSDAFQKWRALAGPFFVQLPQVQHLETVVVGF